MDHLLDEEGYVYKQSPLSHGWQQQPGLLGPRRETNWLNQPRIKHKSGLAYRSRSENSYGFTWGKRISHKELKNIKPLKIN